MDQRTRTHIRAVADALKDDATEGGPAGLLYSGILTGLATAVRIADGSSAEDAMERILLDMEASEGRAALNGSLLSKGES